MVDYVFPQNYITQEGSHEKYPVKTCCVSDDLSGDMLVPSWPNLVTNDISPQGCTFINIEHGTVLGTTVETIIHPYKISAEIMKSNS